jgi:hypothetical protein
MCRTWKHNVSLRRGGTALIAISCCPRVVAAVVALTCGSLVAVGGGRKGGDVTFPSESINSSGWSVLAGSNLLKTTIGQPVASGLCLSGQTTVNVGFWHMISTDDGPKGSLFLFR